MLLQKNCFKSNFQQNWMQTEMKKIKWIPNINEIWCTTSFVVNLHHKNVSTKCRHHGAEQWKKSTTKDKTHKLIPKIILMDLKMFLPSFIVCALISIGSNWRISIIVAMNKSRKKTLCNPHRVEKESLVKCTEKWWLREYFVAIFIVASNLIFEMHSGNYESVAHPSVVSIVSDPIGIQSEIMANKKMTTCSRLLINSTLSSLAIIFLVNNVCWFGFFIFVHILCSVATHLHNNFRWIPSSFSFRCAFFSSVHKLSTSIVGYHFM